MQLLYAYPLTLKTKEGEPFWKLPKRPPQILEKFDPTNLLHASFVTAMAILRAKIFKIEYPKDFRKNDRKLAIAELGAKVPIPKFEPSKEKASKISQEV